MNRCDTFGGFRWLRATVTGGQNVNAPAEVDKVDRKVQDKARQIASQRGTVDVSIRTLPSA